MEILKSCKRNFNMAKIIQNTINNKVFGANLGVKNLRCLFF